MFRFDALKCGSEGIREVLDRPRPHASDVVLGECPQQLDGIEVGRIRWLVGDCGASALDQLLHPGDLVCSDVVHDNDVTRLKCRNQEVLQEHQEGGPVDSPREHHGGQQSGPRHRTDDSVMGAMNWGNDDSRGASSTVSVAPGHCSVRACLVNEDQPRLGK